MDRLYNAVNALEAARSVLASLGETDAAAALQGLEVYSVESAQVALDAVCNIEAHNPEVRAALHYAAIALDCASRRPVLHRAA